MPAILTDALVAELIEVLDWFRQHRGRLTQVASSLRGGGEDPLPSSPEVVVVRTPAGGIPALSLGPGTGTFSGTGTGTSPGEEGDDQPGQAECQVYQLIDLHGEPTRPRLVEVDGLTLTVYNPSETAVAGWTWAAVKQDRWGTWWVDSGGGSCDETGEYVDYVTGVCLDGFGTLTGTQTWSGANTYTGTLAADSAVALTGDVTPAQIAADQDDYAPTGW